MDSRFFREQAARLRALEAQAIKWTIRQGLAEIAADFERIAAELELKEALPAGIPDDERT